MTDITRILTRPRDIADMCSLLEQAGYEAYIVGGCVRDALMGREPSDIDIASAATPDEASALLSAHGYRIVLTGAHYGTIGVIAPDGPMRELTTLRCDGSYSDGRHPDSVAYTRRIEEDLARRDFTINAIALRPAQADGGLIDPFGGRTDIALRVIRAVGNAQARFNEDALRIMRCARFAAQLGFTIESETLAAVRQCGGNLAHIAAERIAVELEKMLSAPHPEAIGMLEGGALNAVLPETAALWRDAAMRDACLAALPRITSPTNLSEPLASDWLFCARLATLLGDATPDAIAERCAALRLRTRTTMLIGSMARLTNQPLPAGRIGLKHALSLHGLDAVSGALSLHRASGNADAAAFADALLQTLADVLVSGEPYRLASLAVNGADMLALGFIGQNVGASLNACLAHVMAHPQKNTREALQSFARSLSFNSPENGG